MLHDWRDCGILHFHKYRLIKRVRIAPLGTADAESQCGRRETHEYFQDGKAHI